MANVKENKFSKRKDGDGKETGSYAKVKRCDISKVQTNPWEDYNKFSSDMAMAAGFNWSAVNGGPSYLSQLFNSRALDTGGITDTAKLESFPGLMVLDYVYGPGYAGSSNDAINMAYSQIMAELYAKTTAGELPFTKSSLAMYNLSLESIAVMLFCAERLMKATSFWITRNMYYPRALIAALGSDYDTEVKAFNNNFVELNAAIRQFNNLKVPKFLDIYKNAISKANNVWVDSDDEFGQIYVFKPKGYYQYIDKENRAQWVELPETYTATEYIQTAVMLMNRWYATQDLYHLNGSLLRAYNNVEFMQIPEMSYTETLNPVHDEVMMWQVMNADIVPYSTLRNLDITEDVVADLLKWEPYAVDNQNGWSAYLNRDYKLLRSYSTSPDVKENCEMTRMCVQFARVPDAETDNVVVLYPNQTMITAVTVVMYNAAENAIKKFAIAQNELIVATSNVGLPGLRYNNYTPQLGYDNYDLSILLAMLYAQTFNYVPRLCLCMSTASHDGETLNNFNPILMGDHYNWYWLSATQLAEINRVANLSLYKPTITPKI